MFGLDDALYLTAGYLIASKREKIKSFLASCEEEGKKVRAEKEKKKYVKVLAEEITNEMLEK